MCNPPYQRSLDAVFTDNSVLWWLWAYVVISFIQSRDHPSTWMTVCPFHTRYCHLLQTNPLACGKFQTGVFWAFLQVSWHFIARVPSCVRSVAGIKFRISNMQKSLTLTRWNSKYSVRLKARIVCKCRQKWLTDDHMFICLLQSVPTFFWIVSCMTSPAARHMYKSIYNNIVWHTSIFLQCCHLLEKSCGAWGARMQIWTDGSQSNQIIREWFTSWFKVYNRCFVHRSSEGDPPGLTAGGIL